MSFRCASISFIFFAVRFARRWPTNWIQFKSSRTPVVAQIFHDVQLLEVVPRHRFARD